ncbi:hypothetical protein HDV03_003859 [Kappamyces sp. JEL0829]|nr:hypothetical protein HDV03_003859 [Kappamyces sp. JEL0829]
MTDKLTDSSGFQEIKDTAPTSPENLENGMQEFDGVDEVPQDETWSWNPVDWYLGIKHEMQTFSLEITEKKRVMIRAVCGEFLVTFLFMFIVMSTAISNGRQANSEGLVLACISTAFAAVALIYSFADVSGAHFNPAVTFAVVITGKTSVKKGKHTGIAYIGVQMLASCFAVLAQMVIFPGVNGGDVGSIPDFLVVNVSDSSSLVNAFFMELSLTFILVYVIFATAFDTVDTKGVKVQTKDGEEHSGNNLTIYTTSGNTKAGFAPVAIGFTLGFLCFIGGTVSGGAFNPARAFGPAVISGQGWSHHWVYWIADLVGAGLAGAVQSFFAHEAQQSSSHVKTNRHAEEAKRTTRI